MLFLTTARRSGFIHRGLSLGLAVTLACMLSACGDQAASSPASASSLTVSQAFQPVASIQELMHSVVDPTADALWDSVSSTVTAQGVEDKRPTTPEEWFELRSLAIRLAESANLLLVPGRPVAHQGHVLEDSHVKDILTADKIQALIDVDRAAFAARALALQRAAVEALQAIDSKDLDKFIEAGGRIDQACEGCHRQYWYPHEKRPAP